MTGQRRATTRGKRRGPPKTRVTTRGKVALGVAGALALWGVIALNSGGDAAEPAGSQTPATKIENKRAPTNSEVNPNQYSHTAADSIWVVVNKAHPLEPVDYEPKLAMVQGFGVDDRMAPHLSALLAAANANKTPLTIISGHRSYDYQLKLYNERVLERGQEAADQLYAKPGRSEHQTGLAADLDNLNPGNCRLDACFANTPGGQWLSAHSAEYGFVIRYPAKATSITGYTAEPWHIRYVGVELATYLFAHGDETLEQFFGVAGGAGPQGSE